MDEKKTQLEKVNDLQVIMLGQYLILNALYDMDAVAPNKKLIFEEIKKRAGL